MNRIQIVCLFLLLALGAGAQDLTGIWRGYFITESGEQYKLEFQIKQSRASSVQGVSYSYLDTRFYGKATMTGLFTTGTNLFKIQELRTVEVRNMGGGTTCLMNYKFSYARSGKEEFLEGKYVGKTEDRFNPKNNGVWGDCGGGTVFLRKVPTSDFYTEPFLKPTAPPVSKATPKPAPGRPQKTTVPAKPPTVAKTPAPKPPMAKPPVAKARPALPKPQKQVALADTPTRRNTAQVLAPRPTEKPRFVPPASTRERKNELTTTFKVSSKEISIRLYDNGEIDDDTISVYLDGQLIISRKKLSASPITYTLTMDEALPEHTLVMVAENLGRIPPNTSLMIVQDGDKRFQTSITSTEQKNAMVRFRYEKGGD